MAVAARNGAGRGNANDWNAAARRRQVSDRSIVIVAVDDELGAVAADDIFEGTGVIEAAARP